ncbi:hypothetical protein AGABI1DRAFT_134338 [Agaricus bisporus var. burnettii JB137-S8]|uniref:Reverse transcriptase domain-containing protein n=1 Tax=Agaricus bisporus var. burnettii (strain JB137-S8 / ATCC MYA-4627 / FGSC 10392) TaxID=597362 RepID=K5WEI9_AGABU|nr:uncharacterized protein AGABI1DRAFT_134338 [Agaricus bisporus var. burnettii JB137-S8]EKM73651.1 hypothetical protein AGABI1DRAFT_134338 [Agaricus bisporus var. burnettii JB137-S8]
MDTHDTLKEAYAQMTSIFKDFGLVMEHTKTELFNFADSARNKNSPNPSINLGVAPFTRESPSALDYRRVSNFSYGSHDGRGWSHAPPPPTQEAV